MGERGRLCPATPTSSVKEPVLTGPSSSASPFIDSFAAFDGAAGGVLQELRRNWKTLLPLMGTVPAVWHPNGFAVFVLGDHRGFSIRLHVWVPNPPGHHDWHPSVHSHDRHVASVVLFGEKSDLLWTADESTGGGKKLVDVVRQTNTVEILTPTTKVVHAEELAEERYRADDYFSQPAGVYHEIPPAKRRAFATLCAKSRIVPGVDQALVADLDMVDRTLTRQLLTPGERRSIVRLVEQHLETC